VKEGRAVSVGFSGVEPAPEPEKEPKKARNLRRGRRIVYLLTHPHG